MKEKIAQFFKSKMNIAISAVQIFAIIFIVLGQYYDFFSYLFFIAQGVVFIMIGIKELRSSKISGRDIYKHLPYSEEQIKSMQKYEETRSKTRKTRAVFYIIIGCIVVSYIFSNCGTQL